MEHRAFLDRESIRLFKSTGGYFVPTLSPSIKVPAKMEGAPFFTEDIRAKACASAAVTYELLLQAQPTNIAQLTSDRRWRSVTPDRPSG